jgi:hypothetical protein
MKTVMRYTLLALAAGTWAAPIAAQRDPDQAVAGGGSLPPGWNVRTERNAPLTNVKFAPMGSGFHVTLGPAALFWRDADVATGSYHAVATFARTKAPAHAEAYGLFIGGKSLSDSAQSYTYLIVRASGEFSIWHRAGYAARPTAIVPWTAHDAPATADSAGRATDELSVQTGGGKVRFFVNGKEVHSAEASAVNADGVVGYRVNHNLDVHVGPIGIHKT